MGQHIVIIGAGAVGGFVGGKLALAGENVTLVDPWTAHVEYINANGLHLTDGAGDYVARPPAINIGDVQSFARKPVDVAIISMKSYDTEWAATMIRQYLSPQGYVVSMQNGMNEERIARAVGWGRTVGIVLSTISVICDQPGHIRRIKPPTGGTPTVFRVGEAHGGKSARATELAKALGKVDGAIVTPNLWGERWTKLTVNTSSHGLTGATGLDNRDCYLGRGHAHKLCIKLVGEAIAVGRAQGYELGQIFTMPPDLWAAAAAGDGGALTKVQDGLAAWLKANTTEPSQSSVGRDVARGRRSEIEFTNGLVAEKGAEVGVPAPTHAALTEIVKKIDAGKLKPDPRNIDAIPA